MSDTETATPETNVREKMPEWLFGRLLKSIEHMTILGGPIARKQINDLSRAIQAKSPIVVDRFRHVFLHTDINTHPEHDEAREDLRYVARTLHYLDIFQMGGKLPGRPSTKASGTMSARTIDMPDDLWEWCKAQEDGAAEYIRGLVLASREASEGS